MRNTLLPTFILACIFCFSAFATEGKILIPQSTFEIEKSRLDWRTGGLTQVLPQEEGEFIISQIEDIIGADFLYAESLAIEVLSAKERSFLLGTTDLKKRKIDGIFLDYSKKIVSEFNCLGVIEVKNIFNEEKIEKLYYFDLKNSIGYSAVRDEISNYVETDEAGEFIPSGFKGFIPVAYTSGISIKDITAQQIAEDGTCLSNITLSELDQRDFPENLHEN